MVINNDVLFGNAIALLKEGKTVKIPVKGYSMLPFIIGERDSVTIEDIKEPVKVDDIVLFRIEGRYILHRVVAIKGDKYIIQGDGVLVNREICHLEDIKAKVIAIHKNGKRQVEPYSEKMLKRVHRWQKLGMLRRWPLAILRRLPGIHSKTM